MTADAPAKKRSQSVASAIFDPKEGTLLGRTAGSWATILTFYLFYYSFLGLLFYGTILLIDTRIQGENGGQFPAINTRLDEPGLSVFPHATIIGDENNEQLDYTFGKAPKKPTADQEELLKENEYIAEQYSRRIANSAIAECKAKDKSIKKAAVFLNKNAGKGLTAGKPYFVLRVNRRANWAPISIQHADEKLAAAIKANKGKFQADTVYFTCEETKAKNGDADFKNLKKVVFTNPTGKDSCGLRTKTNNVGCFPARFYNKDSKANAKGALQSVNPKYTGFNPFAVVEKKEGEEEGEGRKWGEALVQSCWPFVVAQVIVKDNTKPVGIQCRVHVANINSEVGNPQNYGWVKFGFQGKAMTAK